MKVQQWTLVPHSVNVCVRACIHVCRAVGGTLHVLTVDTGRVWAAALITRTFISQMSEEVTLQTPDPQVKASHYFLY